MHHLSQALIELDKYSVENNNLQPVYFVLNYALLLKW